MSSDIATRGFPLGLSRKVKSLPRSLKFLTLLACFGGALWWARATYFSEAATPPAPQRAAPRGAAVPVNSATIATGEFPVELSGLGTVIPSATSIVKTQISGQLLEIRYAEGQMVKAGDVLAQVDPRPYQLTLAQAEGQLQKDVALLHNAERDLQRYVELRKRIKDAIAEQQVDTQRALVNQYKGTVAVDQAQVDQARLNVDYCRIVSLIDGRVGLRQVDQGNYVQANDPNGIVVVTRLSPITVIFTLPESRLQAVLQRFRSGEKLNVVALDHEGSAELARGRLFAIDNQIDSSTGTVKLRAEFPNDDERLYPNQFVNAQLLVETLHDVVLAPAAAIQRGAKGPFVYVIKPDNTVSPRPVKLGPASGERVVVKDGLLSGERVVIEGADKLREGALVALPALEQAPDGKGPRKKSGAS
jgi:multidrug efflux system membrane fusion protein